MSPPSNVTEWLGEQPLVEALWWFIENIGEDSPERSDLFFLLRERYRREHQR